MPPSANMPYIKTEPEDFPHTSTNFMSSTPNFNGSDQQFSPHFTPQQFNGSIDPSALSMNNNNNGNNFGMQYGYGSHNMSGSYNLGSSGFDEQELLESLEFSNGQGTPAPINTSNQIPNVYSSTPDGQPIQSPFLQTFDFNTQYRPMGSIPQHMSPHQGNALMAKRPSLQNAHRRSSEQRSPMTPRSAAFQGLHIGTPDPLSLQNGRAIRTPSMQSRHQKSLSGNFDGTPGSLQSYLDSPLSSPGNALHQPGIGEAMSNKHASLPAKVENGSTTQSLESQEAKKRRRRASHNAVERRRRDNINERIQDLSHLVPQHRLDDDKIRKQLANQGPLSPIVAGSSMSPPNAATSLLAGPTARRATNTAGNITLGLPIDEKEKGPNKGDILNGSVSWTRDLMWALHQKYIEEEELRQYITSLGGVWPFQVSDEEQRMKSEVMEAMEKNDPSTFQYSRADGTGLRVPRYTSISGERIAAHGSSSSPQSNLELSPGFHSGGSGANSGSNGATQPQFWHSAGHTGISFKEEDEFMDEL